MPKLRLLLAVLFVLSPLAARAEDKQTVLLAESTGAYAGGILYSVYLALSDAEVAAQNGGSDAVEPKAINRHLGALKLLTMYDGKLRPEFGDDKTFEKFLDNIAEINDLLQKEGEALASYAKSGEKDSLKVAHRKKESARQLIIPLMGFQDDRDVLP